MNRAILFVDGVKPCCKCKRNLPPEAFHKNSHSSCGYTGRCGDCRRETWRLWNERNPESRAAAWKRWVTNNPRTRKNSSLKWAHGITIDEYDAMFLAQGGVCAICKQARKLCVDHDHKSGRIRGLLCDPCNITLGKMEDDASRLEKAACYIREHNED